MMLSKAYAVDLFPRPRLPATPAKTLVHPTCNACGLHRCRRCDEHHRVGLHTRLEADGVEKRHREGLVFATPSIWTSPRQSWGCNAYAGASFPRHREHEQTDCRGGTAQIKRGALGPVRRRTMIGTNPRAGLYARHSRPTRVSATAEAYDPRHLDNYHPCRRGSTAFRSVGTEPSRGLGPAGRRR